MRVLACSLLLLIVNSFAYAGVSITGTRIIFNAASNNQTVQLTNQGDSPALVQAWLDNGNPSEIPNADQIPFFLTPPLVRIEGNNGTKLRLIAKPDLKLPQDQESLFWFNILDIPPASTAENSMQISVRSRIKLFYRPSKLASTQATAFKKIKFTIDSVNSLTIQNDSPYFITLNGVYDQDKQLITPDNLMLAPFEKKTLPLSIKNISSLTYQVINDFGGLEDFNYSNPL